MFKTRHHYIKQQISVLGSTLFLCPDFDHFLFVHSFESILAQDWVVIFLDVFGNFLYFFGNFSGWKNNHSIKQNQFWVLSSEHYIFETHQIPSSTCFLTWEFQIWFQFSKLKKSDSIIFSTLWMQVGFPTTWLIFQPPKWWDGWNSNHMWHKLVWELKWWQPYHMGRC